jgi:hypothetical protein
MGDIYIGIIRAGEILAKWRKGIENGVSEGETLLEIPKARLPAPSTPAQVLALKIVDLVEVDISMIDLPEGKLKKQAVQITENILENTVIAEPIQITYLSSSSGDEEGYKSNSNDGESMEKKGREGQQKLSSGENK